MRRSALRQPLIYSLLISSLLALPAVAHRSRAPVFHKPSRAGIQSAPELVPLEVLPSGHLVVKAKINGIEGRFILDTGAGIPLVTQQFAQRVSGLAQQDGRFTGFRATGERLTLPLYTARTLTIGSLVVPELTLGMYAGDMGGFDGLISLTAFRQQPFTLDYANHTLVLETAASLKQRRQAGRAVELRLHEVYGQSIDMAAYCRVNEKLTLLLVLDSGTPAGQYRLNASFAPALGIDTTGLKHSTIRSEFSAGQRNFLYRASLDKLTPVGQPTIALSKVPVGLMTGLIYDGILPLKWLGDELTIDLPHKMLYAR